MKRFFGAIALCLIVIPAFATDNTMTNQSAAAQEEQLYQRMLKEMREELKNAPTNFDSSFLTNMETPLYRKIFLSTIVDPSFGYRWDEVPAPTFVGSNAMSAGNAFVATNGWNMQTNDYVFDNIFDDQDKSKPIRGLPWAVIQQREFSAVTHDGILYVFFDGFHHDGHGVAYNPHTNRFPATIDGFEPIGQHWYVWAFDHEFPRTLPQKYEGSK